MLIVGIDEVGRGSLAGPVVAAACLLPLNYLNSYIIDSKKIPFKKRLLLDETIRYNAIAIGIGVVCNDIIDKINILEATKQAMHIALNKISVYYDKIIIDAVKLNNIDKPILSEIKADEKYLPVSAASIIAKVYRDNLMIGLASKFSQYGFEKNFGYGTKFHINAIKEYGAIEIHRRSFLRNIL